MKPEKRILQIAHKQGFVRARDLKQYGLHHEYLRRLCRKGLLIRVSRGHYVPTGADSPPPHQDDTSAHHTTSLPPSINLDLTIHHTLAEASKRIPKGIVCLLSALNFHEIGTQLPNQVWVAIDVHAWAPKVKYPPVRLIRFSGPALTEGIEKHTIEGVSVKITTPEKTVADCFKFRNKIGLDVALEALRECQRSRKCTPELLWKYAKICRVTKVMRPYMEAIV